MHKLKQSRAGASHACTARKRTRQREGSRRTARAESAGRGGSRGCTKASLQRRASGGAGSRTRQGGTERLIWAKREASDEQAQRQPCSQVEEPFRRGLSAPCSLPLHPSPQCIQSMLCIRDIVGSSPEGHVDQRHRISVTAFFWISSLGFGLSELCMSFVWRVDERRGVRARGTANESCVVHL
jgi:hypothetical protein